MILPIDMEIKPMMILALLFIMLMVMFFVVVIGGTTAMGISTTKAAINLQMPVPTTTPKTTRQKTTRQKKCSTSQVESDVLLEQRLGRESQRGADVIYMYGPPEDDEVM